jgi:GTP-binding protein
MIINKAELLKTAVLKNQYPDESFPEIALAGRSNVGKSSLINCITNRKKLARTSGKPGKTRVINFYKVNEEFLLVDLPGYGYANAPKKEIESWKKIIEDYLFNRKSLLAIILLLDIRHLPNSNDMLMYDFIIKMNKLPLIVFTKADKLSRSKANEQTKKICKFMGIDKSSTVIFSALKRTGKEELTDLISNTIIMG